MADPHRPEGGTGVSCMLGVCVARDPRLALGMKSHREVLSKKLVRMVCQSLRLRLQERMFALASIEIWRRVLPRKTAVFPSGGFAGSLAWPLQLSPCGWTMQMCEQSGVSSHSRPRKVCPLALPEGTQRRRGGRTGQLGRSPGLGRGAGHASQLP